MNRYSKVFIRHKWLILAVPFFLQILMSSGIFAQSAISISGKIEQVKAVGESRFELDIRTDKGLETFLVDDSTLIEGTMPAKKIKKGHKILSPSKERMKGINGVKAPFGNMSPRMKKTLGLPDIPEIPNVPEIPEVPKIPQVPRIPNVLGKSGIPSGQNPSSSAQKGKVSEKQPEPETLKMPKDPGFTNLAPNALSQAGKPSLKEEAKKVIELRTTSKGIAVKLEGEEGKQEELILSPNEKVFQELTVKDLHKDMTVNLEVVEDSKGKMAQRIIVT